MGADMLLACVEVPQYEPECAGILYRLRPDKPLLDSERGPAENSEMMRLFRTVMHARASAWEEELEDSEVFDLVEQYLDPNFDSTSMPGMESDARATLRNGVMMAIETIFIRRNRETVEFELRGHTYAFSGGLSSGDAPTEAYTPMQLLEQADITSEPIALNEAEAALAKIEAEKAKEKR